MLCEEWLGGKQTSLETRNDLGGENQVRHGEEMELKPAGRGPSGMASWDEERTGTVLGLAVEQTVTFYRASIWADPGEWVYCFGHQWKGQWQDGSETQNWRPRACRYPIEACETSTRCVTRTRIYGIREIAKEAEQRRKTAKTALKGPWGIIQS